MLLSLRDSDRRTKTEYMECKFSNNAKDLDGRVRIGMRVIAKTMLLNILGQWFKIVEINEDITHRIRVGWQKWRSALGVLYDKEGAY